MDANHVAPLQNFNLIKTLMNNLTIALLSRSKPIMKKFYSLIFPSFIALLLICCAPTTHLQTSKNPSYQGQVYRRILVEARGPSLKNAVDIEWNFRNILGNSELTVIPATDLFLPPRPMTHEERNQILTDKGVQAILVVTFKGGRREETYYPPEVHKSVSKRKDGTVKIDSYTTGGYTSARVFQDHELVLVDLQEKPLWVGTASTEGTSSFQDDKDFVVSLAKKAQKQLAKDGLIRLPAAPPK